MKNLNKIFEYSGYKFNISVEVSNLQGINSHMVKINDMGSSNYHKAEKFDESVLVLNIYDIIDDAKQFVDEREESINSKYKLIKSLKEMGFE